MDNQNRKLELLGNAPIPKALLAMGIPTMIGMLILEGDTTVSLIIFSNLYKIYKFSI